VKTGWYAFSLDMRTFLLPFMFITAAAMQGHFITAATWWEREVLFVSAICLVKPGIYTDIVGMVGMAAIYTVQRRRDPAAPIM